MEGTFKQDLKEEEALGLFLDTWYPKHKLFTKGFMFERVKDKTRQFQGIDFIISDEKTGEELSYVDEKAQLDYKNRSLPTFAFEISFLNKEKEWKKGWLFDQTKLTTQYFLITAIETNSEKEFVSCRVISVDRFLLLKLLAEKNLTEDKVYQIEKKIRKEGINGKNVVDELSEKEEGYFFYSKDNKGEGPINLVLRLNFLIKNKVGRELIKSSI